MSICDAINSCNRIIRDNPMTGQPSSEFVVIYLKYIFLINYAMAQSLSEGHPGIEEGARSK